MTSTVHGCIKCCALAIQTLLTAHGKTISKIIIDEISAVASNPGPSDERAWYILFAGAGFSHFP